jgi:hypothetical protein
MVRAIVLRGDERLTPAPPCVRRNIVASAAKTSSPKGVVAKKAVKRPSHSNVCTQEGVAPVVDGGQPGSASALGHVLQNDVFANVVAEPGEVDRDPAPTRQRIFRGHTLDQADQRRTEWRTTEML